MASGSGLDDDETLATALAGFSVTEQAGATTPGEEGQPGIAVAGAAGEADQTRISGLKLELYSGSRDPQVYRDWRRSLEATRILTGLQSARLAVRWLG